MIFAQPYRLVPLVGILHARLSPQQCLAAAAHSEAASRAPGRGAGMRFALRVQAEASRFAGRALSRWPLDYVEAALGTTCRPHQRLGGQVAVVRRGHVPMAAHNDFGLVGSVGMTAVHWVGKGACALTGALFATEKIDALVLRCGRLGVGMACALSALGGLALKAAVAAVAASVGASWGLGRLVVAGVRGGSTALPLPEAHPTLDATRTWQAQCALAPSTDAPSAAAQTRREVLRSATQTSLARGDWTFRSVVATPGSITRICSQSPLQGAWLAELCKLPDGSDGSAEPARAQAWAHQLMAASAPAQLMTLLQGNVLQLGMRPASTLAARPAPVLLDFAALLQARPQVDTLLRREPHGDGPERVRVDTLLQWPSKTSLEGADGSLAELDDELLFTLTLDVEAPSAAGAATPLVKVVQAQMLIGAAGAQKLAPL